MKWNWFSYHFDEIFEERLTRLTQNDSKISLIFKSTASWWLRVHEFNHIASFSNVLFYQLILYLDDGYSQSFFNARHPLMQDRNLIFRVIIGLNILYGKSLYNREIFHQSWWRTSSKRPGNQSHSIAFSLHRFKKWILTYIFRIIQNSLI